jgi:hypothetical protein
MKYECCICKVDFPCESAIDGYSQGYRVGFLCPHCGANLQDNLFDTHRMVRKGQGMYVALLLAMLFTNILFKALRPEWLGTVLIFSPVLVLAGYAFWKYPSLREEAVMSTIPGPGKTTKSGE